MIDKRKYEVLLISIAVTAIVFSFHIVSPIPAKARDISNIELAGEVIHVLIPAIGFGSTFFVGNSEEGSWDREGTKQAGLSIGTAVVSTEVIKRATEKVRPKVRRRDDSFPSGHTSLAFAGAGFIDRRYGHKWGIPALLGAAFVGYSRIYSDYHFADDVLAGASVGLISSWVFTNPQTKNGNVAIMPMMLDDGAGLRVTVTDFSGNAATTASKPRHLKKSIQKFHYNFRFGPVYLVKNELKAPKGDGTIFHFDSFNKEDYLMSSAMDFGILLDEKNEILFHYDPLELRDRETFSSPVAFGDQVFPAGLEIKSKWESHDIRTMWLYRMFHSERLDVKLGMGVFTQFLVAELKTSNGAVSEKIREISLLPYAHFAIESKITPRLRSVISTEGIILPKNRMLDTSVSLNYQFSENWDISIGYNYLARQIESSDLKNKTIFSIPYLSIAFSW